MHLVGKDILRFHAIYWPAFLLSAGEPLPKRIVAHGWWLRDAAKISKSTGGVVDPSPLIRDFGVDSLRYFLLREMVFGQDAGYSDEAFVDRHNTDLANDLGNLASRVLKMVEDYRGGVLPGPDPDFDDAALRETARAAWDGLVAEFEGLAFHAGLARVWDLVGALNRFIVQHEPWKIARDPAAARRLDTILYDAAEGLRVIAALIAPVMPASADRLWSAVGAIGHAADARLDSFRWGALAPGSRTARGEALFPRIDRTAWLASAAGTRETTMETHDTPAPPRPPAAATDAAGAASPAPSAPDAGPGPATITIDDFARVELRTAKVLAAEKVQGADRLLRLTVDIGTETRTIVAGIAARYAPEAMVGRTIVVVANLKPAKLRGIVSQGMLLAASDASGAPYILTTEDPSVPAGWRVK
jgi:methionyl-tRNA synthetase